MREAARGGVAPQAGLDADPQRAGRLPAGVCDGALLPAYAALSERLPIDPPSPLRTESTTNAASPCPAAMRGPRCRAHCHGLRGSAAAAPLRTRPTSQPPRRDRAEAASAVLCEPAREDSQSGGRGLRGRRRRHPGTMPGGRAGGPGHLHYAHDAPPANTPAPERARRAGAALCRCTRRRRGRLARRPLADPSARPRAHARPREPPGPRPPARRSGAAGRRPLPARAPGGRGRPRGRGRSR